MFTLHTQIFSSHKRTSRENINADFCLAFIYGDKLKVNAISQNLFINISRKLCVPADNRNSIYTAKFK